MNDSYFKNLRECNIVNAGPWTITNDSITKRIVVTHLHNAFATYFPYDSHGEFFTCALGITNRVDTDVQDPARLPGSSGLSSASAATVVDAWKALELQGQTETSWLGFELTEGWVIRHYGLNPFLVFSVDSNGWIGVFNGVNGGALLMSVLDPKVQQNRTLLGELLGR